ncbi:MAG: hypothetical protein GX946_03505 [Oligosphaeraceae bacterium]|nr:hypothetical protein [Oligosphaeraceae bacterium]
MLNIKRKITGLAQACLLFLSTLALSMSVIADELVFSNRPDRSVQGIFLGMDKPGSLSFQAFGEEQPRSVELREISSLSLDKPLQISYGLRGQGKKLSRGLLHGYAAPDFLIQPAGESKARKVSSMQMRKLEYELDMRDYMLRMQAFKEKQAREQASDNKGRAFPLPNKITVVHFADTELRANARQGSLCQRLCKDSKRPAEYVQVLLESLDSKTARELKLKSLPQFWFYKANGSLSARLIERFTDADIEEAFKKAAKR